LANGEWFGIGYDSEIKLPEELQRKLEEIYQKGKP
jgi:hypothetical protein